MHFHTPGAACSPSPCHSLFNFSFFLVSLVLLGLWGYIFFWRSEPLSAFGQTFSYRVVAIAMTAISVLAAWFVLGTKFFIVVGIDLFVSVVHCLLRLSAEETVDFSTTAA